MRSESEKQRMALPGWKRLEVRAGGTIFSQGEPGNRWFAIESGLVKIDRVTRDGNHILLGFEDKGTFLGVRGEEIYPYSATAVGDVMVKWRLASAGNGADLPAVNENEIETVINGSVNALKNSYRQISLLNIRSARDQVMRFLLFFAVSHDMHARNEGWLPLSLSKADIADYLVLRRETVSRIFSELQKEGLLAISDSNNNLLNLDRIATVLQASADN